jgi:Ca2+-binding RTX toxin-like protein
MTALLDYYLNFNGISLSGAATVGEQRLLVNRSFPDNTFELDYMLGTDGNDTITATDQFAVIGYNGDDIIHGTRLGNANYRTEVNSPQRALMYGGDGADTFVMYNDFADSNLVMWSLHNVNDYEVGVDKIDLSQIGITSFDQLEFGTARTVAAGPYTLEYNYITINHQATFTALQLSSQDDFSQMSASDFMFASGSSGGSSSDGTTSTGGGTFTIPNFTAPDLNAAFTITGETLTATGSAQASLRGGTSSDSVTAAEGNDEVYGAGGSDQVSAGAGNDLVYGGSGVISPDDAADTVIGGAGEDVMYGNGGDDVMIGDAGLTDAEGDAKDVMVGGAGNDILYGNGGNDFLYGLIGNDTLVGGSGDDLFVFDYGNGDDLITDFDSNGNDLIAFNAGIFTDVNHILNSITYANGAAYIDMQGQGSASR